MIHESAPHGSGTPARPGPSHLSARTKARKRALDVLFEADLRRRPPLTTLHEHVVESDPPVREFTAELVEGVVAHRDAIDQTIANVLQDGWSLDRMPRVDRALARIAVYELRFSDVPDRVAIAEALVLSGELSTDDSPAFLNGVLSAVVNAAPMTADDVAQVHRDQQ